MTRRPEPIDETAAKLLAELLNRVTLVVELYEEEKQEGDDTGDAHHAFETAMMMFSQVDLPRMREAAVLADVLIPDRGAEGAEAAANLSRTEVLVTRHGAEVGST